MNGASIWPALDGFILFGLEGPSAMLPASPLAQGDTFSQAKSTARRYLVTLSDPQSGNAVDVSAYSSTTSLRAFIWLGFDGVTLATPTVSWDDPAAGTIFLDIAASDLASLEVQPYPLRIEADRSGTWQEVGDYWIDVLDEPSSGVAPYAPGTYKEMLAKGGQSIKQLLTADSGAGFLRERDDAWKWLRQILLAKYRPAGMQRSGWAGFSSLPGYWVSADYPNVVIAGYLDSGKLILTDQVHEVLARKALALLFDRQQDETWQGQAMREHRRADILVSSLVAGIDLTGNGFPSIVINCGIFNTRDI